MSVELRISGMTCETCARHVERALTQAGAGAVDVDWRESRAIADLAGTAPETLARALDGTKYGVQRVIEREGDRAGGEYDYDLAIVGGGYVAMEQAQLFAHLGSRVTMLVRSQLARGEEPEVADVVRDAFLAEGIAIHEGVTPDEVHREGHAVTVLAGGREFRAEHLLVATGRRPRTEGLGLDEIGVELGGNGEIVVDGDLSTSRPRVWAAGDVTGHPQFVYVAAKHGGLVVENAFEQAGRRIDYSALRRITFTNPTIASAGLTEAQAEAAGIECECRVLELEHVPRAIVSRNTRGLVKLVAEREGGRLVGVHIVGDGAGDVILAGSLAIQAGMTVEQLADGWNPYLTLGEGLYLAAQSFHRDPSKLSCCAA